MKFLTIFSKKNIYVSPVPTEADIVGEDRPETLDWQELDFSSSTFVVLDNSFGS